MPFLDRRPGTPLGHRLTYEVCRAAASASMGIFLGYRSHRAHRVPRTGPVLIVANHQSFLDPTVVGCRVPGRHLDFVARRGLFKHPFMAWLLPRLNCIPIDEAGGDTGAIKETLRRLAEGRAVVVFPEGTRSADGSVLPFKRGIALLLKRANCPVIPCAVEGPYDAWPRSRKTPMLFRCPVASAYGHAIDHEDLMRDGPDAALQRLQREVETLRAELHAVIKRRTNGRYPTSPSPSTSSPVANGEGATQRVTEGGASNTPPPVPAGETASREA